MSNGRIRTIFSAALGAWAVAEGIKVSYDNVNVTLMNEDNIKTHLIPVDTFSDTLSGDHIGYLGIFQMTITTKYGSGLLKTERIIEEWQRQLFPVTKIFTDDSGFNVQVIGPVTAVEGKQIGSQWVVPCYFNYRADTN